MKKFTISLILCIFLSFNLYGCNNTDNLKLVRLTEVTHSVFYAPLYVAIENDYFKEEGLKIELSNGGGADNCMTALISKSADIGLMGPETTIYVFNQGKTDYPKVFAQLTQKDGSFLVSRKEETNFKISDLQGKEILAGRKGGVPAMTFEYLLKENNLYNGTDYDLNFNVQFNYMTTAFLNGTADYCTVFEPTASEYEAEGKWHIVASVGELSGEIPYTSFISLGSYINKNEKTLISFVKALKKAFQYMDTHTNQQIAESIVKQFPSTTINSLTKSIESYKSIDAWKTDMVMTESSFTRLQDLMEYANELSERVSYTTLFDKTVLNKAFN